MPRGKKNDLLGPLRAQAAGVLMQLQGQMDRLEAEIAELRGEGEKWRALVGGEIASALGIRRGPGRPRGAAASRNARPRGSARVSWDEVLASVPNRFGVQDVMKHPGAAAKGRAQIYPALNRWEATKRIKRVGKGLYEKAAGKATRAAAAPAERSPAKKRAAAKKSGAKRRQLPKAKAAEASASL
jgi:hypothetical protein